jgi:hypothetical protein
MARHEERRGEEGHDSGKMGWEGQMRSEAERGQHETRDEGVVG